MDKERDGDRDKEKDSQKTYIDGVRRTTTAAPPTRPACYPTETRKTRTKGGKEIHSWST